MINLRTHATVRSHPSVAVLLVAGQGIRLRPLTEIMPKPLVEVAGKCILERALTAIASIGIPAATIVTGYRRELVASFALRQFKCLVEIYNPDYAITGTAQSLWTALCRSSTTINEELIIIEGDMLFEERLLQRLLESKTSACVLAPYSSQLTGSYAWTDSNGHVIAYKHLSQQRPDDLIRNGFKTVNLCKVALQDRRLFQRLLAEVLSESGPQAPLELVFQKWVDQTTAPLVGIITRDERWAEVDDLADLARANTIFADQESTSAILGGSASSS